jgi:N,N'-diacetyllegionaminate synthase
MSADPGELGAIVTAVRRMEAMLGNKTRDTPPREQEFRHVFRKSVVAARPLQKGSRIAVTDVTLKRPGSGLRAREIPKLIGRVLNRDVASDTQITLEMFETEFFM